MALSFSRTLREGIRLYLLRPKERIPVITRKIFQTPVLKCSDDVKKPPPELSDYPGKEFTTAWMIPEKGKIYDKKPFKFKCEKGKTYMWCACGLSKNQPFCDGRHKGPHIKTKLRPVKFIAPEDKEYWFCNCKQTNHRPFCDGVHKDPDIQAAVK